MIRTALTDAQWETIAPHCLGRECDPGRTGPDPRRFVEAVHWIADAGKEAVRAGFAEVWLVFPDAHWGNARHFVRGDRGVSEWTFTGTTKDGTKVEMNGCDIFTLQGGKIALKNSYRKQRTT